MNPHRWQCSTGLKNFQPTCKLQLDIDVGSGGIVQERGPILIVGSVPTGPKNLETTCKHSPDMDVGSGGIVQEREPILIAGSVLTGIKDLETIANTRRTWM